MRQKKANRTDMVAVAARAPAAPSTETTTTQVERWSLAPYPAPAGLPLQAAREHAEIQPPLPPNPQADAATYVDAAALEAAANAYSRGQEPNSPEWFYNCLVIGFKLRVRVPGSSEPDILLSLSESMAQAAGGRQGAHQYTIMRGRYLELTGRALNPEVLRKVAGYVDAVIDEDWKNEWFGFCLGVRQAGMTVEEMGGGEGFACY